MIRNFLRNYSVANKISHYLKTVSISDKEIIFDTNHPSKIAFIGLNRPKVKNALGRNLINDFQAAVSILHETKDIRCVVIGSLVPNIFCAGADLKERKHLAENDVHNFVKSARNIFQSLAEVPVPTICALDGPALGGGLELALACDLRYSTTVTYMGLVETKLAILPGAGGTQRLPRLIGLAKAKELIFTGKTISGQEAFEIGLINACVEQNAEGNAALLHSFSVAEMIANNGPIGVRMAKNAMDIGINAGSVKEGLLMEEKFYAKVIPTTDRIEGLKAFQEKRKPNYTGN